LSNILIYLWCKQRIKQEGFLQYPGNYTREQENTGEKWRILEKRRLKAVILRNHEKKSSI